MDLFIKRHDTRRKRGEDKSEKGVLVEGELGHLLKNLEFLFFVLPMESTAFLRG